MKYLYDINKWLIIITALLYLTFWGGIMAQVILGAIQIIMSISILVHFSEQPKLVKRLFVIYILATISIVFLFIIMTQNLNGGFELVFLWLIITMMLAIFHMYITYKIKIS
ncbi:hypothetical protein [Winogradskyella sp. SM1960]|uniref:hypothetical protein n=1 Tax=Winogradskyella sp. SM1960 TaxID=2865955 RepID=UPI001CD3E5EA|nr:hypothetical protein [Winogradskyella sp. SM1960]